MSNIVVYIDIIISILVSEAFALTLLYVCYMLYCLYPFMASLIGKASSKRSTYKLLILTLAGIILAITLLYSAGKVFPAHYAYAQQQQSLIGGVNIPVNIDVTAIVPININIQNAQICLQVAGGSGSQVVLNPTQTTYSPTTVDLNLHQLLHLLLLRLPLRLHRQQVVLQIHWLQQQHHLHQQQQLQLIL